jgi:hypothetical protein
VCGDVLRWHEHRHHVRTAVAWGQALRNELAQTLQRVARYRPEPLSDGDVALCERTSFRCRPCSRCLLEHRRRYATQAEGALDRCRLAPLSRLPARPLLAERMQDVRGPPLTPDLDHAPPVPMQRLGEETAGRIPEVLLVMHDDPTLAPLAFASYPLREPPKRLGLPLATAPPPGTQPVRMRLPEGLGHGIHPLPLALPVAMPRAFQRTAPVCASALDAPAPGQAQHPVGEGRRRRGKMPCLCEGLHAGQRALGPLLMA